MKKNLFMYFLSGLTMSIPLFFAIAPCFAQNSTEGYTQMKGGKYYEALTIFSDLTEKHPSVADYWRSVGYCSYKIKKYAKTIEALSKSLEIEPFSRIDNKYRGKAYYNLGEYAKAIIDLESYIPSFPHDAPTRLILAVAYKKEGKFDAAEEELKKVATDSPFLEHYAKLQLSSILAQKGKTSQSADLFYEVRESLDSYPLNESIQERINLVEEKVKLSSASKGDKRKWTTSVAVGLEYNDNIRFLPGHIAKSEGDASAYMTASGKYHIWENGPHSLDASGNLYANIYFSEDEVDVIKITPQISYGFSGWKSWRLYSILGVDELMVDGSQSVRSIFFSQKGIKSWKPGMWTSLKYTYSNRNFEDTPSSAEDRDGEYHVLQGTQYFKLGKGRKVDVGATLKSNNTKGDEFDSTTFGLSGGYNHPFMMNSQMRYGAKVSLINYTNPSLYSTPVDPDKRRDTYYRLSLSCSKEFSPRLSAKLTLAYSAKSSNISIYEYNKYSITPSLTYIF